MLLHYLGKFEHAKWDKMQILLVLFPHVVQKQTMGVVKNCTIIQLPVLSEILVSKIIKIW